MQILKFIPLIILTFACTSKNGKLAVKSNNETSSKEAQKPNLENTTNLDTTKMFTEFPMLRSKTLGMPLDSMTTARKYKLLKARNFLTKSQFEFGTFGEQFFTYLSNNQKKNFNGNFTCKYLKFEPGKSDFIVGNKDELNQVCQAANGSINLYFKINVNSNDANLSKERIDKVKEILEKQDVDLSKIEFNHPTEKIIEKDKLSVLVYKK